MIIPVVITVFSDRSFTFIMKTPPVSVPAQEGRRPRRRARSRARARRSPNKTKVGKVTEKQVRSSRSSEDAGHELHRHRGRDPHRDAAPRARWASTSSRLSRRGLAAPAAPACRPTRRNGSPVCGVRSLAPRNLVLPPRGRREVEKPKSEQGGQDAESLSKNREKAREKSSTALAKYTVDGGVHPRQAGRRSPSSTRRWTSPVRLGVNPQARRPDGPRRRSSSRTAPVSRCRVLVFAKGDKAREAEAAGADLRRARTTWWPRSRKASWTSTA